MNHWLDFEDHNVLVVGGTSGINLGIAEGFAEQGANVAVASRSQDKVDAAMERLAAHGRKVGGFSADVRDPVELKAGLESLERPFHELDTLVIGQAGNFPSSTVAVPELFKCSSSPPKPLASISRAMAPMSASEPSVDPRFQRPERCTS